jgi:hypothetical protein
VLQVVKVLGVGVTVEVGLQGFDRGLLQCLFVGMVLSDAVHVGIFFCGKEAGRAT